MSKLNFASGYWTNVRSSWVQRIKYNRKDSELYVEFKSGAVCIYSSITYEEAFDMYYAGSKGKFVWRSLYYLPYRLG